MWMITLVVVIIVVVAGVIDLADRKTAKTVNSTSTTNAAAHSNVAPTGAGGSNTSNQTAVVNNSIITVKSSSALGNYLADPSGYTLYTYNQDSVGTSNCSGSCLVTWPAYQDTAATANLPANISTLKRTDNNQIQYTYKGLPLYH